MYFFIFQVFQVRGNSVVDTTRIVSTILDQSLRRSERANELSLEKYFVSQRSRNFSDSMETLWRVILLWRLNGKISMKIVL